MGYDSLKFKVLETNHDPLDITVEISARICNNELLEATFARKSVGALTVYEMTNDLSYQCSSISHSNLNLHCHGQRKNKAPSHRRKSTSSHPGKYTNFQSTENLTVRAAQLGQGITQEG